MKLIYAKTEYIDRKIKENPTLNPEEQVLLKTNTQRKWIINSCAIGNISCYDKEFLSNFLSMCIEYRIWKWTRLLGHTVCLVRNPIEYEIVSVTNQNTIWTDNFQISVDPTTKEYNEILSSGFEIIFLNILRLKRLEIGIFRAQMKKWEYEYRLFKVWLFVLKENPDYGETKYSFHDPWFVFCRL